MMHCFEVARTVTPQGGTNNESPAYSLNQLHEWSAFATNQATVLGQSSPSSEIACNGNTHYEEGNSMATILGAMNMTLDGNCDHTAGVPDEELHEHFSQLLRTVDAVAYGRKTYQLMEAAWPAIVQAPTGNTAIDEFAVVMEAVPKVVFSHTLTLLNWPSARLATKSLEEEIRALKQQHSRPVCVGSPGLINTLIQMQLLDELQLCIHPVIAGDGMRLFHDQPAPRKMLLIDSRVFKSGIVMLHYRF